MVEGNFSRPREHARDKARIHEIYPPWQATALFIAGLVEDIAREQSKPSNTAYMRASTKQYTFEETVQLTTRMTEEFGPWVNYECTTMKEALAEMDVHGTG